MEEELGTPRVLSWPISSICAVISNYWNLIEVHVKYAPSVSLKADEYPPLTYYTKWYSWRSNVSFQSSSSFLLVLHFHPPSVWENSWHPLMCDWPCTGSLSLLHLTGYLFMLVPGQWNHHPCGTMLQIPIMSFLCCCGAPTGDDYSFTQIMEQLWLFSPSDRLYYIHHEEIPILFNV